MAITDDRDFNYDNEIELVQFIASEMQKERLDINNEENPDSYLNKVYVTFRIFNLIDWTQMMISEKNSHFQQSVTCSFDY